MGLLAGVVATLIFELILKTNKKLKDRYYRHHEIFWGYHIHHSMYGLMSIIASIILFLAEYKTDALFYFSFGIGIIAEHTISDGRFVFIEKQKL